MCEYQIFNQALMDLNISSRIPFNNDPTSELEYMFEVSRDIWTQGFSAYYYINGLVQDCGNSSALALELPQSCTKPSIQS